MTDIWELALNGFESDGDISLIHLIQDNERVISTELDQLVREAGSPKVLNNLTLSAKKQTPQRDILIQIGPGWNTVVTVEAEDHTWAIGRHAEIMESFSKTRKWYAPGNAASSRWPKRKEKRPLTFKNFLQTLIGIPLVLAGALIMYMLCIFLTALAILPTAIIIQRVQHHQQIHFGGILLEFLSLAFVAFIFYAIAKTIMAGFSKVVIRRDKFWSPGRIVGIGTVAGVIAAIASVLALLK